MWRSSRNVWTQASRYHSTQIPHPPSSTVWVTSSSSYPRPMATWNQRHHIYPSSGRFFHQIHIPWQCTTFTPCIERKIYNIIRLGDKSLHWDHLKVGLQQTNCWTIHARVCNCSSTTFPPSTKRHPAIIPTPPCRTNIRRQSAICSTRGQYRTPSRRRSSVLSSGSAIYN